MIRRLNGHSLQEAGRFSPESMPLTLCERQSQASIAIGPEVPEIIVGDWLQDMDEPGEGIVWRVKTVEKQPLLESRTVQLEHLINTLKDELMFGEVTPKTITGNNSAVNCTAGEAIAYILGRQGIWTLGSIDSAYSGVSNPYSFNGESLFAALENVTASLEDAYWEYSFDTFPFVLSIKKLDSTVDSEMRASRNIQTLRYTVDRSRMYTRFYPIGKNNLHIDGDYVSRNEETYGTISKVETDQSKSTKAELLRWANERISRHCEPSVTVTIAGLELSEATGEPLDHFTINKKCRVPLPDYGTTITEKVTKLQWADKIKEKEKVTVTLANLLEDVASIINSQNAKSGGGGRAAAKNAEEDHAWFVDTTDHVAMVAEAVAGEGASQDWSRVAELVVDGNGIHQRVQEAQEDIVTAFSLIEQTSTAIRIEMASVVSQVHSFIEMTPEMIHAEVSAGVSTIAHSVIEQTATYIHMEVENAASSITHSVIEQTTEYIQTTVEATASNIAWSVITQTMTNIEQKVARKSTTYTQPNDPNDGTNELHDGDIWIKRENAKTWDELANTPWNSTASRPWESFYGDYIYTWKNGAWRFVKNTAVDVENEVKLEQTKDSISLIGHAVDAAGNVFNSNLEVTARQIRGEVSTAEGRLNSVIEQTSTYIRSQVNDAVNGLSSSIEQTASSIRTEVTAAKSAIYSTIEQTASQIRTEVSNSVSNLQSSITQQANRISLLVEGTGSNAHIKPAEIVASINNGSSTIKLSADHIDIDGLVNRLKAIEIQVSALEVTNGLDCKHIDCTTIDCTGIGVNNGDVTVGGKVDTDALKVGDYNVSWKSLSFVRVTNVSPSHRFLYAGSSGLTPSNALLSNVVTSYANTTIYYLGR